MWSYRGAFCSHPLGPPFLDHLQSDLVGSLWTSLFWYAWANANLLWSLFAVSGSKACRREWRRLQCLDNCHFRPHVSIHFLTQAPISSLRMPSNLHTNHKVRLGIGTFKIFLPNWFQTGRYLIWPSFSPLLRIFTFVFPCSCLLGRNLAPLCPQTRYVCGRQRLIGLHPFSWRDFGTKLVSKVKNPPLGAENVPINKFSSRSKPVVEYHGS